MLATCCACCFIDVCLLHVFPLFAVDGQVADALNTPFEADSFDLVWSMESGEHMPHKPKYVALRIQTSSRQQLVAVPMALLVVLAIRLRR